MKFLKPKHNISFIVYFVVFFSGCKSLVFDTKKEQIKIEQAYLYLYEDKKEGENTFIQFVDYKSLDLESLQKKIYKSKIVYLERIEFDLFKKSKNELSQKQISDYNEKLIDSFENRNYISYKFKISGTFDVLKISSFDFNEISNVLINYPFKKKIFIISPAL